MNPAGRNLIGFNSMMILLSSPFFHEPQDDYVIIKAGPLIQAGPMIQAGPRAVT
jgi:hypothetical protein